MADERGRGRSSSKPNPRSTGQARGLSSSKPRSARSVPPTGSGRGPSTGSGLGARPPRPPGLERPADEPRLPADFDTRPLHRSVRAELRGLPKELAETVAGHLVLAGQLIDTDPEQAFAHAQAARRRAARLPIVREAAAETAYAAGHYDTALSEFRALRRMTGTADHLPVMADCERALGRPQAALKLAKEARAHPLDLAMRTEMTIVEAGARDDLGQHAEALRVLAGALESLPGSGEAARLPGVRLRYAYAEALLRAGREEAAREHLAAAAAADADGETDAQDRVDALDGLVIDFDPTDDGDEPVGPQSPAPTDSGRPPRDRQVRDRR